MVINDLGVADLDTDGSQEYIVLGGQVVNYARGNHGFLGIGSQTYPALWEYSRDGVDDWLYDVLVADSDGDGHAELLLGGQNTIQLDEPWAMPGTIAFLPVLIHP